MKNLDLKRTIFFSFLGVILLLGIASVSLGFYQIQNEIVRRSQQQIINDLKTARSFYNNEIEFIKNCFLVTDTNPDLAKLKSCVKLDYVLLVKKQTETASEIAREAFNGKPAGGSRIIQKEELKTIFNPYQGQREIEIIHTPKERPDTKKKLETVLAMEFALPHLNQDGTVESVLYGGKIINKDNTLIDKIHKCVFEDQTYNNKPIGTVTIFQDDVRISTNVLDETGRRAIGTRVSESVYNKVLGKGEMWTDRAFVVTDWYLTAYEPIRNIHDKIIGILYVGTLEKPFIDNAFNMFIVYICIFLGTIVLVILLTAFLAGIISQPLTDTLNGMRKIADGNFHIEAKNPCMVTEFRELVEDFNIMATEIDKRENSLKISNTKLATLNKSYLELIGFVSHELKGILSSIIMNAYSIKDGFLGEINPKQGKALESITRNLDYLAATVVKFFSLSRIEKGELYLDKVKFPFKKDVVDISLESFKKLITDKRITVVNQISENLEILADKDLLQIVMNNFVGNAAKYGSSDGRIIITSGREQNKLKIGIYNDGPVIPHEKAVMVFNKFYRLENVDRNVKGTGLGLFINKEIIEKHGGTVWVEPQEAGNQFYFTLKNE